MLESRLVEEVQSLMRLGIENPSAASAIGYRETTFSKGTITELSYFLRSFKIQMH